MAKSIKSEKGFAHILGLLVIVGGLILAVYLIGQKTNLFSKASLGTDSVESLTAELEDLNNQQSIRSAQGTDGRTAQMLAVATDRKNKLTEIIDEDPASFLRQATLADKRNEFPDQIKELLEEKKNLQGDLYTSHFDNLEGKGQGSSPVYVLRDSNQGDFEVFLTQKPDGQVSGSNVIIQGVAIGKRMATADTVRNLNPLFQNPLGVKKLAIFLINFSNNSYKGYDRDRIKDTFFSGNGRSINTVLKEMSFNKLSITGDVFGYYTLDPKSDRCDFELFSWKDALFDQIRAKNEENLDQKIDLDAYDDYVLIFNSPGVCNYGGFGLAGNRTKPGIVWIFDSGYSISTQVHELGHTLGIAHANSLICIPKVIDDYDKCLHQDPQTKMGNEYGDPYDTMGRSFSTYHFNGPHKVALYWIDDDQVQKVTQNGTYKISGNVEEATKGIQVLKIAKPDTDESYYLSYRQKIGLDSFLPTEFTQGASLHVWSGEVYKQTKLLDMTPETPSSLTDASFTDGQVFTDEGNRITIKQLSHDQNSVILEIQVSSAPKMPEGPPPNTNLPSEGEDASCPTGTVHAECIGYTSNNINTYCWGANSSYLGGIYSKKCEPKNVSSPSPSPKSTPSSSSPPSGSCADQCFSDDLRTSVGRNKSGVCDSGYSSTSHPCVPENTGAKQSCNGKLYTCSGSYWQ